MSRNLKKIYIDLLVNGYEVVAIDLEELFLTICVSQEYRRKHWKNYYIRIK